jgi:uncharacterized protein (TIGR02145 family)
VFVILNSCSKENKTSDPSKVTDIDGNVYDTVIIGNQVWLKENLKVTRYNNGQSIKNIEDAAQWSSLRSGAWSYYNNDPQYNDPYGKLYNSFAVQDARKICPKGWHVPTDIEWTALENYIGGRGAGGALKEATSEAGTSHWVSPNIGATNLFGFTALPGGYRTGSGQFPFDGIQNLGSLGLWWSSTFLQGSEDLWIRVLDTNSAIIDSQNGDKNAGLSCRCISN